MSLFVRFRRFGFALGFFPSVYGVNLLIDSGICDP